jgi:hypothetical protein
MGSETLECEARMMAAEVGAAEDGFLVKSRVKSIVQRSLEPKSGPSDR